MHRGQLAGRLRAKGRQSTPHRFGGGRQGHVVPLHQKHHPLAGLGRQPQPPGERRLCQRRPRFSVAVKMALPVRPQLKGLRFANVVDQRRQPQQRQFFRGVGLHRFHGVQLVLPHVVLVPGAVLVKAHAGGQLRQNFPHHFRELPQHPGRGGPVRRGQQLPKLLGHSLPAHQRQPRGQRSGGPCRVLFHRKAVHRSEAKRPQNAQGVL